jgi:hypothetical protein
MLKDAFDLAQSVLEQPKNKMKGPWEGLTLAQMMDMLRHEFENELLPEYAVYQEDPAQGIEGMIREIPDCIILLSMIQEKLMGQLRDSFREVINSS